MSIDMNVPITANLSINVNCVALDPAKAHVILARLPQYLYTPDAIHAFGQSVDAELDRLGIRGMVLILPTDADIQVVERQEETVDATT